jgi:SAM-dependent methyltransferase
LRKEHLKYLRCPACQRNLRVEHEHRTADGRIEHGLLRCKGCRAGFPIVRFVPRFVPGEEYVESFGFEWTVHRRTQYDRDSGIRMSETRFFDETGWPRRLDGQVLIEAGSGSGRFTEHALATGALVLSFDHSQSVDANYASNGCHDNLLLVQADLFRMPFPSDLADRLFCFGVLQHTPDPRLALGALAQHVRPGGELVADIYVKSLARYVLATKYWVRPITRRVPHDRLYRITSRYVDFMWPVARRIRRVPRLGKAINWRLLIGDYGDVLTNDGVAREWARLDTFDMLAPRYDNPARAKTVRRWCAELGLQSVAVARIGHGLRIRARRPVQVATTEAPR